MKNTQAKKLTAVLEVGSLSEITGAALTGLISHETEQEKRKLKKFSCWRFVPYSADGDLEITCQFSDNPFTIVNYIFNQL